MTVSVCLSVCRHHRRLIFIRQRATPLITVQQSLARGGLLPSRPNDPRVDTLVLTGSACRSRDWWLVTWWLTCLGRVRRRDWLRQRRCRLRRLSSWQQKLLSRHQSPICTVRSPVYCLSVRSVNHVCPSHWRHVKQTLTGKPQFKLQVQITDHTRA